MEQSLCKEVAYIDQLHLSNQKLQAGLRMKHLKTLNLWLFGTSQLWKRWNIETLTQAKPWPSHKRKSHSVSLTFSQLFFFWVHWPRTTQHSQPSHSSQHYLFENSVAVIQMINPGRNPHFTHVTRTHRVDLDWLCGRVKVDRFILITFVWTNDQVGKYSDKGNVFQDPVAFIVTFVARQTTLWIKWCPQLFSPTFLLLSFRKLQAMSQVMTLVENFDQIWSHYAPKVLISGCALDGRLTLEQLSNNEFSCTRDRRDLPAWMLFVQKAEVDTPCRILRNRVCETTSLVDWEMSKMHDAKVHVFSESVLCVWKGEMNDPVVKFTKRRASSNARSMSWFDKIKEKMEKFLFQKLVFIEFHSWEWWTKIRFLQRNQKEVRTLHVHQSRFGKDLEPWKVSRWPKRKMGWTGKASYGRVFCSKASNSWKRCWFGHMRAQKKFKLVVRLKQSTPSFWHEIKSNQASAGPGKPVAQNITLLARTNLEHEQPPIQGRSWSTVPRSRDPPDKCSQFYPKRQSAWRGTLENVTEQEHHPGENTSELF